jgi:predicted ABC-type ATPase
MMPEMYVFAGCNGAGKSTLIEHFGSGFEAIINPDLIAKQINPEQPRKADLSAGKLAIKEIRSCFESQKSFAIETTLSGQFIIKQMLLARTLGYTIHLYYIGLQDVQMHIDRVRTRVLEGGHFIAAEDIVRRYDVSLNNLKDATEAADVVVLLDNSRDEYDILLELNNGKIQYRAKWIPQWLKNLDI